MLNDAHLIFNALLLFGIVKMDTNNKKKKSLISWHVMP